MIEFKDNGIGIADEDLSRIFDPGFTKKGSGVGTGLGLSITYQIIDDHKGKIEVESEFGKDLPSGSFYRVDGRVVRFIFRREYDKTLL